MVDRELVERLKREMRPRRFKRTDGPAKVIIYAQRTLLEKLQGMEQRTRAKQFDVHLPQPGGFSGKMRHARRGRGR